MVDEEKANGIRLVRLGFPGSRDFTGAGTSKREKDPYGNCDDSDEDVQPWREWSCHFVEKIVKAFHASYSNAASFRLSNDLEAGVCPRISWGLSP